MFCEKCGTQLPDNARFCENCGAKQEELPVVAAPVEQPVAQPVYEVPAPVAEPAPQPVAQPQPPKERKPIDKKKLILMIVAAATAFALTLAAIIVIPMLNKVKVQDYIEVNFATDYNECYDGKIKVTIDIDDDAIVSEKLSKRKLQQLAGTTSLIGLVDAKFGYIISPVTTYCTLTYRVKGSENTEFVSADTEIKDLKSTDVLEVKIDWSESEDAKRQIKQYQKLLGIKFSTKDKVVTVKLSDEIKKADMTVKQAPMFDLLGYLKDNNLIDFYGIGEGAINVTIKDFETTSNGYTFSHSKDEDSNYLVHYSSAKGDGTVYIGYKNLANGENNNYGYNFSKGDKVKVSLNEEMIDNGGIFFTKTEITVTVDGDEPITESQASANYDKIVEAAKNALWSSEDYNGYRVTLYTANTTGTEFENIVTVVIKRTTTIFSSTYEYYYAIYLRNVYLDDEGNIKYGSSSSSYLSSDSTTEQDVMDRYGNIAWTDYTAKTINK